MGLHKTLGAGRRTDAQLLTASAGRGSLARRSPRARARRARIRGALLGAWGLLASGGGGPTSLAAQMPGAGEADRAGGSVPAALGGFVAGGVAGFFVAGALVTARARFFDHYLYSPDEAIVYALPSMWAGATAGATLGGLDDGALGRLTWRAYLLGGAGFAVGAGLGYLVDRDRPLALAFIGTGAGLLAGAVWGALADGRDGQIPVAIRLRH